MYRFDRAHAVAQSHRNSTRRGRDVCGGDEV